jgi:hypothetical protein|tara:strand:+ start:1517 stop:2566 length:1050 start_codon:yes stop_codon:yes gene_type:complete
MPFQKVEYSFPDEEKETSIEIEDSGEVEIDLSGKKTAEEYADTPVEPEIEVEEPKAELEIEIVDDTPEDDRNRTPRKPPADVTEEELEGYSKKVRKRIHHFSQSYHDERRAKETAVRERQELEALTQRLLEENKTLKGDVGTTREALLEQAKRVVDSELNGAKIAYKDAYESGDADRLIEAQEHLTSAKLKADRLDNFKLPSLQEEETEVQEPQPAPQQERDPKAEAWVAKNPWFHSDDEMTAYAMGLHQKLVKSGVDPRSDEYYERIDARMRKVFPEEFDEDVEQQEELQETQETRTQSANVVAPATRSTAPNKVRLTKTQVALANRLGVPLEEYARQAALEMRNNNG